MGIQMNQKELTKTFVMISNRKNPFVRHGFYKKKFSALRVKKNYNVPTIINVNKNSKPSFCRINAITRNIQYAGSWSEAALNLHITLLWSFGVSKTAIMISN